MISHFKVSSFIVSCKKVMKDEYICFPYIPMLMLLLYTNFPFFLFFLFKFAFIVSGLSSNHANDDLSMSLGF